ncbi:hypothetical protein GGR57DRAFT_82240 [Xylariaceae sp. FL1272]|nr:hypothetical protein GGR57DRAFT_82240 [Xylariaceae sp. FL1272]
MSTNMPQGASLKPEYQHFVPQFILRNFAHKYKERNGRSKGGKKGDKLFRGQMVVNNVNLTATPICIEETQVKRILGQYDMYQDTSQPVAQQREIESLFGQLESYISTICRKITKAYDDREAQVWLTRDERNAIRKFLFLLKYRNSTFHRRFYHEDVDSYDSNDKGRLWDYMKNHGFKRPVDVWFHNIKTLMKVKMDTQDQWRAELQNQMYPDDARWFMAHCEMMYMAICTPSQRGDEFILTDQSYSVFEGPNNLVKNPETGKFEDAGWVNFHEFAPLSPKLMIVLRSFVLPSPLEDANPEIQEQRQWWRDGVETSFGMSLESSLGDLPICKARNNYTRVSNGRMVYLPGEDGTKHKSHKFCFQFFPIGTEHVNKINLILFDNAYSCTSIVFGSQDSFYNTLEWYLTVECEYGKQITGNDFAAKVRYLESLSALLKTLGSDKQPVWKELPDYEISDYDKMQLTMDFVEKHFDQLIPSLRKAFDESSKTPTGLMSSYRCLGGTSDTFIRDLNQAERMLQLRIKIDVWSNGIPEHIRAQARTWLIEAYMTCPSRRVLFFVKRLRYMLLGRDKTGRLLQEHAKQPNADEPEDIIAKAAHTIMTSEKLNGLMYRTAMNDIEKAKDPSFSPWAKIMPYTTSGEIQLQKAAKFVEFIPGQLKNCGIGKIEKLAQFHEKDAADQKMVQNRNILDLSFLKDDKKAELVTRILVKPAFSRVLSGDVVDSGLLAKFERIMFELAYPTPPIKVKR